MKTFSVDERVPCIKDVKTGDLSFDEKQKIVEEYIQKVNPYKDLEPLNFDLRGYAEYVKEHNVSSEEAKEVCKLFIK